MKLLLDLAPSNFCLKTSRLISSRRTYTTTNIHIVRSANWFTTRIPKKAKNLKIYRHQYYLTFF